MSGRGMWWRTSKLAEAVDRRWGGSGRATRVRRGTGDPFPSLFSSGEKVVRACESSVDEAGIFIFVSSYDESSVDEAGIFIFISSYDQTVPDGGEIIKYKVSLSF
jgi:hypothetical protein